MKKYSSGSFIEAAVRVYGSEADTITSFPAKIYADGESASALIKGNLQQSGTPTAAAPITPTECGDLSSAKYVIPFQSGNTTTDIDLSAVNTTRKIKKRVFTSDDTFSKGGNGSSSYFVINLGDSTGADLVCTHYINTPITASNTDIGASITSASQNLRIRPEGVSDMTVDQFHAWVAAQVTAGTPLTVWYILAAESTGILNEPLRKIGDNVDSVSATVPTLATAENINIDTTLKPSALQLTYTGWHTHSDKKRSGGAWT